MPANHLQYQQPLSDITVLDLSRLFPGGFCTLHLADLGARVIKIEEPGVGDFYREASGQPLLGEGYFEAINRGKESLSLNLKSTLGKKILRQLVRKADVLIESFRPGRLKKLGFAYERLRRLNRKIILCSITGYGQTGPYAQRAGHDLNYMGLSGLLSLMTPKGSAQAMPGFHIADLVGGGLYGVASILAALHRREKMGEGTWIDLSMTEGAASIAGVYSAGQQWEESQVAVGNGLLDGGSGSYQVYSTRDGSRITLAALEAKFWQAFVKVTGLQTKAHSGFDKPVYAKTLKRKIAKIIRLRSLKEWMKIAEKYDLCMTPIKNMREVIADSQLVARNVFHRRKGPRGRVVQFFKSPFVFNGRRLFSAKRAPRFAEHNVKVLRELGYSAMEVRQLKQRGIIS